MYRSLLKCVLKPIAVRAELELLLYGRFKNLQRNFVGLSLDVHAYYADKGFVNKHRNTLSNSNFFAMFAGSVFEAS